MSAAWGWLFVAAAAEVAWSQSIKPTEDFTRLVPTVLCFALAVAAVYPLTRAMQNIPVGTAYAVFTAVGACGAIVLGVVIYGDPVSWPRAIGLVLVLTGVVVLQATTTTR